MMGHREKLICGSEYDYLTRARRYFRKRPGYIRWLKRKFGKRVRHEAKAQAQQEASES